MSYKSKKPLIVTTMLMLAMLHIRSHAFALSESEIEVQPSCSDLSMAQELVSSVTQRMKIDKNQGIGILDGRIDRAQASIPSPYKNGVDRSAIPNLLVFISLSMPKASILQLSQQVQKAGGVLILRGMHEGSMKKTIAKLLEMDKQGVSVLIDPISFKEFEVQVVPTFILRGTDLNTATAIPDKMEGNVPLDYVLEVFAGEGNHSPIARQLLAQMRGRV